MSDQVLAGRRRGQGSEWWRILTIFLRCGLWLVAFDPYQVLALACLHEVAGSLPTQPEIRAGPSSFLKCGVCGRPYSAQGAKSGQFAYYICGTLFREGAGTCSASYLNAPRGACPRSGNCG